MFIKVNISAFNFGASLKLDSATFSEIDTIFHHVNSIIDSDTSSRFHLFIIKTENYGVVRNEAFLHIVMNRIDFSYYLRKH